MALDRNLVVRTLSGIVMLVVVLGAVLASPYTMAALFVLLTIGAQLEFYKIARLTSHPIANLSYDFGCIACRRQFRSCNWRFVAKLVAVSVAFDRCTVYYGVIP